MREEGWAIAERLLAHRGPAGKKRSNPWVTAAAVQVLKAAETAAEDGLGAALTPRR